MKKRDLLFAIGGILLVAAITIVSGATWTTKAVLHTELKVLRAEADEDSTTLDLTTSGDYDNMPSGAVQLKRAGQDVAPVDTIEIFFCGGSAANKTFTYTMYAYRAINGPAKFVATGTGTLGTQAVVEYPHSGSTATSKYWADTLSVTSRWLTTVKSTDTSGNNECASLVLKSNGYEWFLVLISSADGSTGDEAGDISVYYAEMN